MTIAKQLIPAQANVRGIVNERTYATLSQEERAALERLLPSPDRNADALVGILKGRNAFFNDSIVMYQNVRPPFLSYLPHNCTHFLVSFDSM
jgi:hypothetical protein